MLSQVVAPAVGMPQPEDLRRVNRLWANDSLYLRKTLAIPLALCNDTGPRYAKPTVTAMSINGEPVRSVVS